ncbi:MAG: hypothetical protein Q4F65_02280 [Propionibacteriaceae bacterium]|nr:hypothetical protein [Propionibacteriaceae bacterium]
MNAPRGRGLARTLGGSLLGLVLLCGAFMAGRESLGEIGRAAQADPLPAASSLWAVKTEQVGRIIRLNGTLARGTQAGPPLASQGVLTSIDVDPDSPIMAGATLFTVNLRPVVAGQGTVPAFRDLGPGTEGADVVQLRGLLCGLGRIKDCSTRTFDPALAAAVKKWNRERGVGAQDVVRTADILWFPALPDRVVVADKFEVGARVEPGQQAFTTVGGDVALTVEVTRDQAALVPVGSAVHLGPVEGVVTAIEPGSGEGRMAVRVSEPGSGQPLCAASATCADQLGDAQSRPVEVVVDVVPRVEGLAVPTKAVRTDASGSAYVVDEAGLRHDVTVRTEAGGLVLCDGLTEGMQVNLDGATG